LSEMRRSFLFFRELGREGGREGKGGLERGDVQETTRFVRKVWLSFFFFRELGREGGGEGGRRGGREGGWSDRDDSKEETEERNGEQKRGGNEPI